MAENSPNQQFFIQLNKAKRALVVLPPNANEDITGAAFAIFLFIKRLDKEVILLSDAIDLKKRFSFLPDISPIKNNLGGEQSFAIAIDTSQKALEEVSYQQDANKVKIFLKSKGELYSPEDLSFETERTPYDLIILVGAKDMDDLGELFERNSDVFFETPKVNIDNHPGNKYFGSINLVDINAASVAEVMAGILEEFETDLIDEDIATCLFSGIVAKTKSFQHPQVTPALFLKASSLMAKGARQQEIVKALFKTKPLSLLKLWGRSLARAKDLGEFALAVLTLEDFEKSEAETELLPLVFKELMENFSNKKYVALLNENKENPSALLAMRRGADAPRLFEILGLIGQVQKEFWGIAFMVYKINFPRIDLAHAEDQLVDVLGKMAQENQPE